MAIMAIDGDVDAAVAPTAITTDIPTADKPDLSVDTAMQADASPTKGAKPPAPTRAKSSSSNKLTRWVSRSSSSRGEPTSPSSSGVEADGTAAVKGIDGKVDRAALEKPRGKYKSGVNWNVPGLTPQEHEPWMDLADGESPDGDDAAQDDAKGKATARRKSASAGVMPDDALQMLSTGATAAAKAYAAHSSFGNPLFATHQRAALEAGLNARMAGAQQSRRLSNMQALTAPVGYDAQGRPLAAAAASTASVRPAQTPYGSPPSLGAAQNRSNPNLRGQLAISSAESSPGALVQHQQASQDRFVVEAAQRVLAAARLAAQGKPISPETVAEQQQLYAQADEAPEAATTTSGAASPELGAADATPTQVGSASPAASIKSSKRRTFLGIGGGSRAASSTDVTKAGKKGAGSKPSSRRASEASPPSPELVAAAAATATAAAAETKSVESNGTTGTSATTGNGTVGQGTRRRRWKDTRQLDLLATELAAEALLGGAHGDGGGAASFQPGSFTSDGRRTSMMSILAAQPGNGGPGETNGNGQLLAPLSPLPMPQPPFAAGSSHGGSSSPSSSRHGSPVQRTSELPRSDATRIGTRSLNSLPVPSSQYATQSAAKLRGLPSDMLAGLGDGPYPQATRRSEGFEPLSDPFGIPLTHESPYDISASYANRTNVYHTPSQIHARSRMITAGTSAPSTPGNHSSGARRSVLTMSMHSPETEHQGLTKAPKSGRGTPWGSRAPSRNVTPSQSRTNLREAFEADAVQQQGSSKSSATSTTPTGQAAVPTTANAAGSKAKPKKENKDKPTSAATETSAVADSAPAAAAVVASPTAKGREDARGTTSAPSASRPSMKQRLSFFGMKKAKATEAAEASARPEMPSPPSSTAATPKAAAEGAGHPRDAHAASSLSPPLASLSSRSRSSLNVRGNVEPSDGGRTPLDEGDDVRKKTGSAFLSVDEKGSKGGQTGLAGLAGLASRSTSSLLKFTRPKPTGVRGKLTRLLDRITGAPASAANSPRASMALDGETGLANGHAQGPGGVHAGDGASATFGTMRSRTTSSPGDMVIDYSRRQRAEGIANQVGKGQDFRGRTDDAVQVQRDEVPLAAAVNKHASASRGAGAAPQMQAIESATGESVVSGTSSDGRVAMAYLNEEMAKQGFGTRNAYAGSSVAAVTAAMADAPTPAAATAVTPTTTMPRLSATRSVSSDGRHSGASAAFERASPYTSEGSQEPPDDRSGGGSESTRSTDTSAGMAPTPMGSAGLLAKTDVVPLTDSEDFTLTDLASVAAKPADVALETGVDGQMAMPGSLLPRAALG